MTALNYKKICHFYVTVRATGRWNLINPSFIIIIIIITLFESQIILAEHECCTNWGDCKSNKSNQIKCWFLRRGENRSSRRKTSRSRVENQQTQPTYDAGSGNRTRDTLVEGERSHHYTNPAPRAHVPQETFYRNFILLTRHTPGDIYQTELFRS